MKIGHSLEIKHSWLLWAPWASFAVGFLMNALVMAANRGQMPVLVPGGDCGMLIAPQDLIHTCMTASTRLKWLADWIVVNNVGVLSPGDLFMTAQEVFVLPCVLIWATLQIRHRGEY
ncbi:MAG: DUF5317 family protein [Burkholderiales bacterium]